MKKILRFKFAVVTIKQLNITRLPYFITATSRKDAYIKLIIDIYENLEENEVLDRIEFISEYEL